MKKYIKSGTYDGEGVDRLSRESKLKIKDMIRRERPVKGGKWTPTKVCREVVLRGYMPHYTWAAAKYLMKQTFK